MRHRLQCKASPRQIKRKRIKFLKRSACCPLRKAALCSRSCYAHFKLVVLKVWHSLHGILRTAWSGYHLFLVVADVVARAGLLAEPVVAGVEHASRALPLCWLPLISFRSTANSQGATDSPAAPFFWHNRLKSRLILADLVFRLLHRFSGQFSSLEKLVLAFHKNVCLSPCALFRRMTDDPVAVYESLDLVLCATAVICLASSTLTERYDARFLGPSTAQKKRAATSR